MPKTTSAFNDRMRRARKDSGLSIETVVITIHKLMPEPMACKATTIQRLETETPEAKADPFLLAVLATIYGVRVSDLSEIAAGELGRMRDLLTNASRCIAA